ncbi:hypothetical protein PR048_016964 [Dryococelus australis]|uniref:Uncharacterized protein n=1 Tax=Dryococelus australis TaxID=614101 RepID=A0ABQ9H863_9NEOP|nr:hypothetical protein PR048_016964 [Dryococelus australis]
MEFGNPASWLACEKSILCYTSVSGHSSKSHSEKIDIILYVLGDRAEEIWTQFEPVPDILELSLKAFSKYFTQRRKTIFESYKFNSHIQEAGETVGNSWLLYDGSAQFGI